jgi:hypothetical protein
MVRKAVAIGAVIVVVFVFGGLAQEPGNKFALLVGINRYDHGRLPELKYAERDVAEMDKLLRELGYKVTLLKGDAAVRERIEKEVKRVAEGCKPNDLLVLGFAGHGFQFTGENDSFFCPRDGRPFQNTKETLVSLNGVTHTLEASFASTKILLVDACRDDPDMNRGTRGINDVRSLVLPEGTVALFSCSAKQRAFEPEILKHGVFFHSVMEGLRGKAANERGEVTFNRLSDYVFETVPRLQPEQKPQQRANISDNPVLARVRPRPPELDAALEKPWHGSWTRPGFEFEATLYLQVQNDGAARGRILWKLTKTDDPRFRAKISLSATEYVKGSYDSKTRQLVLEGYDKEDPDRVIGLDAYKLILGQNNDALGGVTRTHQGTWDARIDLAPLNSRKSSGK